MLFPSATTLNNATQTQRELIEKENNPSKWTCNCVVVARSSVCASYSVLNLVIYDIKLRCTFFSGFERHLEDAQKKKDREEADYVQKMVSFGGVDGGF